MSTGQMTGFLRMKIIKCHASRLLVYEVKIDSKNRQENYLMRPVGHSHYSGKTGELFTDLSTITTALQIADSIVVRVK